MDQDQHNSVRWIVYRKMMSTLFGRHITVNNAEMKIYHQALRTQDYFWNGIASQWKKSVKVPPQTSPRHCYLYVRRMFNIFQALHNIRTLITPDVEGTILQPPQRLLYEYEPPLHILSSYQSRERWMISNVCLMLYMHCTMSTIYIKKHY